MNKILFPAFFALLLPLSAIAKDKTTVTVREYKNICKDCGIEKVFVHLHDVSQDYEKHGMHSTMLYAGFEAKTWEDAKKYGFVQYIRGCTFDSREGEGGKIERRVGEAIHHLNERRTFVFPDWSVDATTKDPIYFGAEDGNEEDGGGRLSQYRWTKKPGEFMTEQSLALHEVLDLPAKERSRMKPRLFVVDTPSSAQYRNSVKSFVNVALDFKMCLHKLEDIPEKIEKDIEVPHPIHCFTWDSHLEYDFKQKRYARSSGKGMHPFCATQTPMNPAKAYQKEQEDRAKQSTRRIILDPNTLEVIEAPSPQAEPGQ